MEKRVYVYDDANKYKGYVRLDQDEIGYTVGEVYNTQADRLGAIKYETLNLKLKRA